MLVYTRCGIERERGERERGGGEGPGRTEEDIRNCVTDNSKYNYAVCTPNWSSSIASLWIVREQIKLTQPCL